MNEKRNDLAVAKQAFKLEFDRMQRLVIKNEPLIKKTLMQSIRKEIQAAQDRKLLSLMDSKFKSLTMETSSYFG